MNPWAIIVAMVAVGVLTGGAYMRGRADGENKIVAQQQREGEIAVKAAESAASAAAFAISKIEMKNVQIRQPLETIVRTEQVFRDCRSGAAALGLLNATASIAPASAASAAAGGELPASGPAR